jgi:PAS domain S-box-containing protein
MSVQTIRANEAAIFHTLDVINTLEVTLSTLRDAESGQRGFVLTGEEKYFEPYAAALSALSGHQAQLRALLAEDPAQLARFAQLEQQIAERLSLLANGAMLRRTDGIDAVVAAIRTDRGKRAMERVRATVGEMQAEERRLLATRTSISEEGLRTTVATFAVTAVLNLLSLLLIALLTWRDMKHREQGAEALRTQREWFEVTLASIGDAVIATDSSGRVTFMNGAAVGLTGWSSAAAVGRPSDEVFRIVNEATREPVESPIARVLRDNMIVGLANHTVLLSADGVERPIDDSGAPIRKRNGEVLGVVLIFRDVSERRRYERGLQQALMARDQFFSIAAHELRTPLTSLLGNAELLQRRMSRSGLSERDQRALRVIVEQGRRLNQLIAALLDVSRLELGQFNLQLLPLELGSFVRRIVDELLPSLDQHQVMVALDNEPLLVQGDELRLEQVFQNLLQNAVKYSPDGGQIAVTLQRQNRRAVVTIADQGIGIAEEARSQLFQRFYRAAGSHSNISGLGVGLYVVKEIVDRHGGEVWVTSEEGAGSTFFVALPLAEPMEQ